MDTSKEAATVHAPVEPEKIEISHADVLDRKHYDSAADHATELEHRLTVREAFARYPMAVVWSVLFCVCIIMDGYDSDLITNLYGLPSFKRKYGFIYKGAYTVSAPWQTAFAMSSPVGRVIGGGLQGHVAEAIGRKWTLIGCLVTLTGFIFLTFFAPNNAVLLVGEMLCGVIWGILTSLAPTYASEVCPLRLRDLLTAYVNLCWSIGELIASGVLAGYANNTTEWAYRIPFGLQWMWPVLILTFVLWAPESPYWLVRHGKIAEAEKALQRLSRAGSGPGGAEAHAVETQQMLALIQRTNDREREMEGSASYFECFKGVNLRRTEISAMAWAIQILSGLSLPFYAVVFFEEAGFPTEQAFNMNVGMTALGFVGTCLSFVLIPRFGRRTLFFNGLLVLTGLMLLIGFMGIAKNRPPIIDAEAALLIIWFFVYFLTVGPLAYVIFTETSSTRLRGHTVAIALIAYSSWGIVYNVASPYLINASAAGLGAKTGLVYGAISLLCCFWCYFRLPECKDRTFEELDIMFERKVPTRQFKDYVIQ
ncbi:Sugar/inositol transporter [Niveomyces insectorum RCEF 264]|uniref:Sugar/inositol transporter n=1 Tax=Niveomyces insectorum RCEF 264 TaxID=1081102 RepID=A0A167QF28_9HYPO|nr:Sugar/inositol transporter [Niveomyces insectorum RCEF 264]